MSLLIVPIVDLIVAGIAAMDAAVLGDLPKFATVGRASPGQLINPPSAWVMGLRTTFPDEGEGSLRNQVHLITVRLGIAGTEPEELLARTMAYVRAVDIAIRALTLPDYALRLFVGEHDYGPLFKMGAQMSFWPDLHLSVTTEELS